MKFKIFVKDRQFYRSILIIAVPVIMQSLITAGVNLMDTVMLTACGELELSASSLANQFISLFQFMCNGLGFGAAVLTAQYFGRQDMGSIRSITTLMLRVCLSLIAFFMALSFFFPRQVMTCYTNDAAIIEQGVLYLRISALTFLFHGLSQVVTMVLRSAHKVRLPLITSVIAFFVNIFFNWVLIFGKLGAPEMRIKGAALGTLIARVVEFGIIVGYFLFFEKTVGYRLRHLLLPCKRYIKEYVHYCVPVLISDTLLGLGNNMVSVVMGHIGQSFVAAYAVVSQITRMTTVLTQGISSSASILTGNTLGAGDKKRAYNQGITFLALAVCVGLVASLLIIFVCPYIITATGLSPETTEIAIQLIQSVSITIVFSSVQSVLTKGVLRGGGDTRFLMFADVLFLWLVSVPLGYLTGIVWHCSAFITYLALHADWIIKSVWCTFRLLKGKWVDNVVKVKTPKEGEQKNNFGGNEHEKVGSC